MTTTQAPTRRLYVLGGVLLLWFLLVGCRLAQLQVAQYGDWVQRAQRQQQRTIEVAPRRGVIYDRKGRELAMSISVDSVFAVPNEVPDHGTAATLLARVIKSDPKEVLARLKSSRTFCWIARKVDAETGERIRALKLRGIHFQKEPKRFYPKRELAAQVLGYVGLDDEGLAGVERGFDKGLTGRPGKMLISVDARRKWFGRVERHPDAGQNVVLTIDENIQYIAERELELAMQETRAEAATIVVQNPRTGEILALANRPTFNPNLSRHVTPQQLKNRAVSDIYEPGSTFKIVTIAAALEEKLARPEEAIDCQMGSIVVGGLRIRDHHPYGLLTVSQVLANSSDVGTIKLGMRLGEERLDGYIRKFGFGTQTGIELPGETRGMAKPASRWSKASIGAISMGQEIGITPLQLVSMVSTIANDGVWSAPRIVAGVTPPRATPQTVVFRPAQQRRVISTLTAAEMKKMMESVVLFGTGRKAILDGYTSAGKTGTAQKVDPATGTYSHTKYVATFAGFAPVNDPAVTVAVIIDSAVGLHQGGQISAPVFQRVTQQVLEYLNVRHDIEVRNPKRLLLRASAKNADLEESSPDHLGGALDAAEFAAVEPQPAAMTMPGKGARVIPAAAAQKPAAVRAEVAALATPALPKEVPTGGTVVLEVESGPVAPSFIGKSMRGAIEQAQEAGVEIEMIGSGVAREQFPPAGMRLPSGRRVAVRFGR